MGIELGQLRLFTVDELATKLGIQERTICEYLKDGRLQGRKMANKWYVPESSLRAYFEGLDMVASLPSLEQESG